MKKVYLLLFTFLLSMTVKSANADESYTCSIYGNVKGIGISLGVGGQVIGGKGNITCLGNQGTEYYKPIKIKIASAGIGYEVVFIKKMTVESAAFRIFDHPDTLINEYKVGPSAGVTLLNQGFNFDAAISISNENGFGTEVSLTGQDVVGLGVKLHGKVFKIKEI